jgi:hypothetical protein
MNLLRQLTAAVIHSVRTLTPKDHALPTSLARSHAMNDIRCCESLPMSAPRISSLPSIAELYDSFETGDLSSIGTGKSTEVITGGVSYAYRTRVGRDPWRL